MFDRERSADAVDAALFLSSGDASTADAVTADALTTDLLHELVTELGRLEGQATCSGGPVTDAERIDQLEALECLKAGAAAAQARITATFVASQAQQAADWAAHSKDRLDANDFEGWRAARDQANAAAFDPAEHPLTHYARQRNQSHSGSSGSGGSDQSGRSTRPKPGGGVAAQVGLARRESPHKGARLTTLAVSLTTDLPHTLAALTRGLINEYRAELVAAGVNHLHPDLRVRVDAEVIGAHGDAVGRWGNRELEHRIRAHADHLDAEAATERARRAASERRVTLRPVPDTMARLSAELPASHAVAAFAALRAAAATAKAEGDARTQGQLMADTLIERLTGTTITHPATSAAATDTDTDTTKASATDPVEDTSTVDATGETPSPDDGGSAAATTGPSTADVPMETPAAAGANDHASDRDRDTNSGPPGRCPEQPTPSQARPAPPTPAPTTASPPTPAPDPASPPTPPVGTPIEIQLIITDRTLLHGDDTPAYLPGYGPVPAPWARDLLTPARPPDSGRSDGEQAGPEHPRAEPARVWLRRLYTHPGTGTLVAMDSTRRLFDPGLRRYLLTRDRICRTPWCDAAIRHADHIRPAAAGGPTTDTNGQGLCVGCNLTKEHPGWSHEVTDPGPTAGSPNPHTVKITTPTGRTYTSIAPPVLPQCAEHRAVQPAGQSEAVRQSEAVPQPQPAAQSELVGQTRRRTGRPFGSARPARRSGSGRVCTHHRAITEALRILAADRSPLEDHLSRALIHT